MAKSFSKARAVKVALVGGETLLGHELKEVLESRRSGAAVTEYASTGEGNFGEQEGEAVYLEPLEAHSIREEQAILVAGTPEGALKVYTLTKGAEGHPAVIDCTGHLEHEPEARMVAPLIEEPDVKASWLMIIAHPAASALVLALSRLARYRPIRQAVANIFEPASERGKRGVSELHRQTTDLLSFKPLKKDVFDAQVSFNLLSRYGGEASTQLSKQEQRIERHTATLLSRGSSDATAPMPSIRLIQAPVFHGYSISLWVEFESDVVAGELGEALASAQIEVRSDDLEAPNNVGAAAQSGLSVGDIRIDRNNGRAAWFWIVGDNLRLTADAAADLVSGLE